MEVSKFGSSTAFGVSVAIEFWSAAHHEVGITKFKMFENIDVLPEKVRNDPSPSIAMYYNYKKRVIGLSQPIQGREPDSLKLKENVKFESFDASFGAGYVVSITLSGSNLRDEDRMTRRYNVGIMPIGQPDIMELKGWKVP